MDLYIRNPGDPNYRNNALEIQDEVEILVELINMLLFTEKTEILGEHVLGSDLERLIYELDLSKGQIETTILDQIERFVPLAQKYTVSCECVFYRGTVRDIATLDILIDGTPVIGTIIN